MATVVESISNSSQTLINCGSRVVYLHINYSPLLIACICMISDDSPSKCQSLLLVFSKAYNKEYERLFELPVSADALLNKYRSKSSELGFT
jgi:hypothetical protein